MVLFEKQIEELKKLLSKSKKIVIVPHKDADGDTIGASMAWFIVLNQKGFEVDIISPTIVPQNLRWMKGYKSVTIYENRRRTAKKIIENADLLFFIDFNSMSRTGEIENFFRHIKAPRVLVDHHPNPEPDIANIFFSDDSASSTCELCYDIFNKMGFYIDVDIAESLYTGIITDTGKLTYGTIRPHVFNVMAELTAKRADKDKIFSEVYQNISLDSIRLLGHSLCNKLEVLEGLPVAFIALTKEELEKYNYKPGNTEDFVNYPLTVSGITISALFSERKKDYIKISLRSKGNVPINEFAKRYFNGGGHINASGGEMYDTLENVVNLFKKRIRYFLKNY